MSGRLSSSSENKTMVVEGAGCSVSVQPIHRQWQYLPSDMVIQPSSKNISAVYVLKKKPKETASASRNDKKWYIKEVLNRDDAEQEVLKAQFLSLLCSPGTHPKTRVVENPEVGRFYIASEEIKDFIPMDKIAKNNKYARLFQSGVVSKSVVGFGEVILGYKVIKNYDAHLNNVALSGTVTEHKVQGRVIGFDLGMSLLHNKQLGLFTHHDLDQLPLTCDSEYNWFDSRYRGVTQKPEDLTLSTVRVMQSDFFKKELYDSLLRFITIPDAYIDDAVAAILTDLSDREKICQQLKFRKKMFLHAAVGSDDFRSYVESMDGDIFLECHCATLSGFNIETKVKIWGEQNKKDFLRKAMDEAFSYLKDWCQKDDTVRAGQVLEWEREDRLACLPFSSILPGQRVVKALQRPVVTPVSVLYDQTFTKKIEGSLPKKLIPESTVTVKGAPT